MGLSILVRAKAMMDKNRIWLIWALCVFGLGLMISLSTTALLKAAIAGWIVYSTTAWWWVTVGLVCSLLCTVTGIGLAVRGLVILVKKQGVRR